MSTRMNRIATVTALALIAVFSVACGGIRQAAQNQKRANDLKEIGLAYHNYVDSNQKGPSGPQDLMKLTTLSPSAAGLLQSGELVIIWGVKPIEMTQGASNTVLAYEAAVPTSGGLVLMGDASTRTMTAAEFQAAPKATPKK